MFLSLKKILIANNKEKFRDLNRNFPLKKIIKMYNNYLSNNLYSSSRKSWDQYIIDFPQKFIKEDIDILLPQPNYYNLPKDKKNEWESFLV